MEQKDLLLDAVCGYLPYGLKCLVSIDDTEFDETLNSIVGFQGSEVGELYLVDVNDLHVELYFEGEDKKANYFSDASMEGLIDLFDCKPYLRSITSMTEEEQEELRKVSKGGAKYDYFTHLEGNGIIPYMIPIGYISYYVNSQETFNRILTWLKQNRFDYLGLIKLDLAIEVTEENNPYK